MGNILQLFNQMNPKKTTETRRKSRKKAPLRGPFLTFLAFEGAEPSVATWVANNSPDWSLLLKHWLRFAIAAQKNYENPPQKPVKLDENDQF